MTAASALVVLVTSVVTSLAVALGVALGTAPGPVARAADAPVVGGPRLAGRGVLVPAGDAPRLPRIHARSYVVADLDAGTVLAAKDPHGRYAPASTLKMLTALAAFPHVDPDRQVRPTFADMSIDGTKVGVDRRRTYRARDLERAMLMMSANDAAQAVARTAGGGGTGGVRRTVARMNAEAARLQASDTTARTPTGLDARGQASSAYDLCLVFRAALKRSDVRSYLRTETARFPALRTKKKQARSYQIGAHNRLLFSYRGDLGGKNGFTEKARASYVGAARRGGHTIVIAMMRSRPYFWPDATKLLEWGFAARGHADPVGTLAGPRPAGAASTSPTAGTPKGTAAATPSGAGAGAPRSAGSAPGPLAVPWPVVAGGAVLVLLVAGVLVAAVAARRRTRALARARARAAQVRSWRPAGNGATGRYTR